MKLSNVFILFTKPFLSHLGADNFIHVSYFQKELSIMLRKSMFRKRSEKGQAIILIVFSIIGIIGLTALTVDGGRAYTDRRQAQGAADSAAWAGGLANSRGSTVSGITAAAQSIADANGYNNNNGGTRSVVNVKVEKDISGLCPPQADPETNRLITVEITSYVKTFFGPVIGIEQMTNHVVAVTRACGTFQDGIFGGQSIFNLGYGVGGDCAFNSGQGGARWNVICSGIYSNTCANSKEADSVKFFDENGNTDPDLCVTAVGGTTGGLTSKSCGTVPAATYDLKYAKAIMPPNPCSGTPVDGVYPEGGLVLPNMPKNGSIKIPASRPAGEAIGDKSYVYCVKTDAQVKALQDVDVELNYATLYFDMEDFELRYAGNVGSIYGTPTMSGTYSSYSVIVGLPNDPETPEGLENFCTGKNDHTGPEIMYRGNAKGVLYGTFLAPSACVDMRGNAGSLQGQSDNLVVNGQVVSNMLTSNGTANITVDYCKDQHRQEPAPPTIILVQ
jgi:hypothetical protein